MVKDYLKDKNISFTDVDVAADQAQVEEMVKKSGQMGVPVVDVNGQIIVGFNRPAIDQALGV